MVRVIFFAWFAWFAVKNLCVGSVRFPPRFVPLALLNCFQKTAAFLTIDFEARADYFVTFFLEKDFGFHGKDFDREILEIHEQNGKTFSRISCGSRSKIVVLVAVAGVDHGRIIPSRRMRAGQRRDEPQRNARNIIDRRFYPLLFCVL
jgi:hypothetical protein